MILQRIESSKEQHLMYACRIKVLIYCVKKSYWPKTFEL